MNCLSKDWVCNSSFITRLSRNIRRNIFTFIGCHTLVNLAQKLQLWELLEKYGKNLIPRRVNQSMMATTKKCKWHWCFLLKCIDVISYTTSLGQLHLNYYHPKLSGLHTRELPEWAADIYPRRKPIFLCCEFCKWQKEHSWRMIREW